VRRDDPAPPGQRHAAASCPVIGYMRKAPGGPAEAATAK
jgi:hypothetical protein